MKQIIIALGLAAACVAAQATVTITPIGGIKLDQASGLRAFVRPNVAVAVGGCRTSADWPFVLDLSTDLGKRLYATLLLAYGTGKMVKLQGSDTCALVAGTETLTRIESN